jgi:hypothetical protein
LLAEVSAAAFREQGVLGVQLDAGLKKTIEYFEAMLDQSKGK